MRTFAMVLAVVLVNDAVLLFALDVAVPAWLTVAVGAFALTALFAVGVTAAVDEDEPPSRGELQREVESLRERVDELEG